MMTRRKLFAFFAAAAPAVALGCESYPAARTAAAPIRCRLPNDRAFSREVVKEILIEINGDLHSTLILSSS